MGNGGSKPVPTGDMKYMEHYCPGSTIHCKTWHKKHGFTGKLEKASCIELLERLRATAAGKTGKEREGLDKQRRMAKIWGEQAKKRAEKKKKKSAAAFVESEEGDEQEVFFVGGGGARGQEVIKEAEIRAATEDAMEEEVSMVNSGVTDADKKGIWPGTVKKTDPREVTVRRGKNNPQMRKITETRDKETDDAVLRFDSFLQIVGPRLWP